MEANPIEHKHAASSSRARTNLSRYRGPIIAAAAVLVLGGIAFLLWSQKKAKEFDEAFRKGMASWEQRQGERAVAEFRKAALVDDRDPELWVMIGRAELLLGQADRALAAWEEALRRQPGYKPALFERGKESLLRHLERKLPPPVDGPSGWLPLRIEIGTDDAQRILADLRAAAGHASGFTKFAGGAIHLVDGRYKEAQPLFQAYSEVNGWDAGALAILGIAGRYGALPIRAERALTDALALRHEKLWLKVRAEARFLQGNYEGARADYREAGLEKESEPLFARPIPSQGLILWLRADAGVDVTGSSVSRWQDQSGRRHDAAPKDPDGGPRLIPTAVQGRPALLFSGKEDELRLPDGFEDFGAGLSVFAVGEPRTEPVDESSFIFLATAARGAGRIEVLLGRRRDSAQIVYSAEDLVAQTKPFVEGIAPVKGFDGISAIQEPSGTVRLYKRGQIATTGTLTLPRKILRTRNRVGAGLQGHVAEIVLYNRSISELERIGVEAHLKARYFPDPPSTEKR